MGASAAGFGWAPPTPAPASASKEPRHSIASSHESVDSLVPVPLEQAQADPLLHAKVGKIEEGAPLWGSVVCVDQDFNTGERFYEVVWDDQDREHLNAEEVRKILYTLGPAFAQPAPVPVDRRASSLGAAAAAPIIANMRRLPMQLPPLPSPASVPMPQRLQPAFAGIGAPARPPWHASVLAGPLGVHVTVVFVAVIGGLLLARSPWRGSDFDAGAGDVQHAFVPEELGFATGAPPFADYQAPALSEVLGDWTAPPANVAADPSWEKAWIAQEESTNLLASADLWKSTPEEPPAHSATVASEPAAGASDEASAPAEATPATPPSAIDERLDHPALARDFATDGFGAPSFQQWQEPAFAQHEVHYGWEASPEPRQPEARSLMDAVDILLEVAGSFAEDASFIEGALSFIFGILLCGLVVYMVYSVLLPAPGPRDSGCAFFAGAAAYAADPGAPAFGAVAAAPGALAYDAARAPPSPAAFGAPAPMSVPRMPLPAASASSFASQSLRAPAQAQAAPSPVLQQLASAPASPWQQPRAPPSPWPVAQLPPQAFAPLAALPEAHAQAQAPSQAQAAPIGTFAPAAPAVHFAVPRPRRLPMQEPLMQIKREPASPAPSMRPPVASSAVTTASTATATRKKVKQEQRSEEARRNIVDEPRFRYMKELKRLVAMGFSDTPYSREVLTQCSGNLGQASSAMLVS